MPDTPRAVAQIRSFNRFYTHILGLLDRHILASDFSLTEARVLLEISKGKGCKAHELSARLGIDRSYLSRILRRFEQKGLIRRAPDTADARATVLSVTPAATAALSDLSLRSDAQVDALIRGLPSEDLEAVLRAMALIRAKFSQAVFPVTLRGYRDRDAEYIIRRHRELYSMEYGLSDVFAHYVDQGVHKLADHLDPKVECILIPEAEGRPLGSIAIARVDAQTAQLRYFLLEPDARGYGLGQRLVAEALDFARKVGYRRVILETISALTTARTIYRQAGFHRVHSKQHADWGPEVEEEWWELTL